MEAHILLADSAQASPDGKVHALGLGWSNTVTPLPPQAVVILIKVPWDLANEEHSLRVELQDEDGKGVSAAGPLGAQAVVMEGTFEPGRPPGVRKGTPLDVPFAFNVGPGLPLSPGRYVWMLTIDGETREEWRAPFQVRQQPGQPAGPHEGD